MEEIKKEADRIFETIYEIVYEFQATDEVLQTRTIELALICLDEKIKTSNFVIKMYEDNNMIDSDLSCQPISYYEQVKQYIKDNY